MYEFVRHGCFRSNYGKYQVHGADLVGQLLDEIAYF